MLKSKERSKLRGLASVTDAVTQIGKDGISEGLIESLSLAIAKRELIKVTVLENSGLDPKEAGVSVAGALKAELVCVTGRKIVLYRKNPDPKAKHIEF